MSVIADGEGQMKRTSEVEVEKCYREGEDEESSDACLHPAMIRVDTG